MLRLCLSLLDHCFSIIQKHWEIIRTSRSRNWHLAEVDQHVLVVLVVVLPHALNLSECKTCYDMFMTCSEHGFRCTAGSPLLCLSQLFIGGPREKSGARNHTEPLKSTFQPTMFDLLHGLKTAAVQWTICTRSIQGFPRYHKIWIRRAVAQFLRPFIPLLLDSRSSAVMSASWTQIRQIWSFARWAASRRMAIKDNSLTSCWQEIMFLIVAKSEAEVMSDAVGQWQSRM